MKKYEINNSTLAVIGVDDKSSKVMECSKSYQIEDNSYQVMEDSCNYFGSSFRGRIEGTKKMIGVNYKVPIIIEETNDLIFFPLSEIESNKCVWISLKWFDKVEDDEDGNTYIYLKNGKKIKTSSSKYSIENQVLKSTKLHFLISDRKNI